MFVLNYEITIGDNVFNGVNSVNIKRIITSLTGTAVIKMPTTAAQKQTDGTKNNILTTQAVKKGDSVTIKLGYNGNLQTEFVGYVSRINGTQPLEVECEDNIFLLKEKKIAKTFKDTTLDAVLSEILEGTGISYTTGDASINIKKLILATDTGEEVPREAALLEVLKRYGLVGYFNLDGSLFVGLRQGQSLGGTKLVLGWNTVKEDELKFFTADEQKYKIKAIYIKPNGDRIEAEAGDSDGSQRTIFLSDVEDESQLKELAENELLKYKYDGYQGQATCFLQPFIDSSYSVELEDPKHSERNGVYYCEGVEISFGMNGARRVVHIGAEI